MNQYRALQSEHGFQLMPVSKDAIFAAGFYDPTDNTLMLQSVRTYQDFRFVAKLNDYGEQLFGKGKYEGKPLIERRTIDHNYQYTLKGNDLEWFLYAFVENAGDAKRWMIPVGHQSNPEEGLTTQKIDNNE